MLNFLHYFKPESVLLIIGPVKLYWYGLFIVTGTIAALTTTLKLAKRLNLPSGKIFDLSFYLIIGGLIGARLYHIFLELPYYLKYPIETIKVWQGGLAIHGAIIVGLIILLFFCRKEKINFWLLSAAMAPGLALGQTIGRWGNYFNQELFGLPTSQPWGIPIDLMHRPLNHLSSEYFHPTFLYESIGNLIIFIIILFLFSKVAAGKIKKSQVVLLSYLALYSLLRFLLEFIRIDQTAYVLGWRWPQIISIAFFTSSMIWLALLFKKGDPKKPPLEN
jgi:phosphatidylglycerol:prolipoprotein diacylglycerol transferase